VKRATGRGPFRHRDFRLLVGGQLTSNIGDAFYAVALPWYVLSAQGGAVLLGTVLAAYGVPRTVLLVLGGHASDRWRPWTVMMGSDAARALAVAALSAAVLTGPPRPIVLVPIAVVIGAGEGIFLPGSMSVIPALLPAEELQAGNGLSTGLSQLSTLIGPAIGGTVVALAGPGPAFAADAATFVASVLSLAGIRAAQRARHVAAPASGTAGHPDVAGEADMAAHADSAAKASTLWQLARSEAVLQVIFVVILAANLGSGGMAEVALPALAHGPFRAGAAGYGGLLAALGAGSIVGALCAGRATRFSRPAVVGSAIFLAEGAFISVVPYGPAFAAPAWLALAGALVGFGDVLMITEFQKWAPPAMLGRLMGLVLLGSFGTYPISVVAAGFVVRDFGPAPFFPAAGGAVIAAVLWGLSRQSWRDFGAAPREGASEAANASSPRGAPRPLADGEVR